MAERLSGTGTRNDKVTSIVNQKFLRCNKAPLHEMELVREVWTEIEAKVSESRDEWRCIYCDLEVAFPTLKRFIRWAELGEMGNEQQYTLEERVKAGERLAEMDKES